MEHIKCWFNDLFEGIENNQNSEVCIGLLKKCGTNCAKRNALPGMHALKEKIAKSSSMDEIPAIISRYTGAECIPLVDGFILTYNRGKECDCSLVKAGYVTSPVFCNCTLGFHETVWAAVFERPVTVELQETFLRGGNCCAQKIIFKYKCSAT